MTDFAQVPGNVVDSGSPGGQYPPSGMPGGGGGTTPTGTSGTPASGILNDPLKDPQTTLSELLAAELTAASVLKQDQSLQSKPSQITQQSPNNSFVIFAIVGVAALLLFYWYKKHSQ